MERCCCFHLLCLPFKKFRKNKEKKSKEAVMASSIVFKHRSMSVPAKNGAFIPRLTEDAVEDEIEDNLRQVDETLNSIKHLAVDINVQLSIQEPKLDRIQELIENSDLAMGGAKERVKKLLAD
ncbi:SNARE domain protein [Oesophagostomum dentatum]|uniref:SNARE domain protein n=1 Tax=Oesophagostomum dentatum TaxID=61180 RepID=A0A0B1TP71_OESDE|nr:SNARE domain protein [Oesophagostomum dentatum]